MKVSSPQVSDLYALLANPTVRVTSEIKLEPDGKSYSVTIEL
jgi:hypothetical protein